MKELLVDSVYTVEPKDQTSSWSDDHWNYQWSGRSMGPSTSSAGLRWREEGNGTYVVRDPKGAIWRVDQEELDRMLS